MLPTQQQQRLPNVSVTGKSYYFPSIVSHWIAVGHLRFSCVCFQQAHAAAELEEEPRRLLEAKRPTSEQVLSVLDLVEAPGVQKGNAD